MKRSGAARLACGAVALAALGWAIAHAVVAPNGSGLGLSPEALARSFCVPLPAAAKVDENEIANREIVVPLPSQIASTQVLAINAMQGEIVRLTIPGGQPGAVGMHGLTEIVPIHAGETITIAFRTIYAGRFPLHFHGIDGSHLELVSLEVRHNQRHPIPSGH
ncbi:hypothetical protein [Cupriavidus necator]